MKKWQFLAFKFLNSTTRIKWLFWKKLFLSCFRKYFWVHSYILGLDKTMRIGLQNFLCPVSGNASRYIFRSSSAVCILGQRFSLFVRCSLDPMTAVFATQFSNFAIIECRGALLCTGKMCIVKSWGSKDSPFSTLSFFKILVCTKLAILNDNKASGDC